MAVTCKDILELPELKKMKVAAGRDGLNRIIRWVHVADIPQVIDWVQGGELLFITGIGIRDNSADLLDMVQALANKNLAGLVVNLGPYISEIPHTVVELADRLSFPVFELPWEVKLVDVTQTICSSIIMEQVQEKSTGHLLEDILFSEYESPENLLNRAAFYGYDMAGSKLVMIADIDDFSEQLKKNRTHDEERILELKNQFRHVVNRVLDKFGLKIMNVLRSDSVIMVFPSERKKERIPVKRIAEEIRDAVAGQIPGITVSIGIGENHSELKDLAKSYKESEFSLKIAKSVYGGNSIVTYGELGIYKLLFKTAAREEMEAFCREMAGPLQEYDKQYNTELISTLEAYLGENCNLQKTAELLNTHRNTLKYRIMRIEEITGKSLHSAFDRLNLQTALLIARFIRSSD